MSSSCTQFETLLSPYLDGELAPAEAGPVAEHLAACEPCRDVVAAHELVRGQILKATLPALAPETVRALVERARTPGAGWRQLAAAVLVAVLVPAAVAVASPRLRSLRPCACDTVTPGLDLGL